MTYFETILYEEGYIISHSFEAGKNKPDSILDLFLLHFPHGSAGKESTCNAEDLGLIPGLGRSPGGAGMATHSNILGQRNPIDRGAWWATVHGITKSQTQLSNFTLTFIYLL